MPAGRTRPRFSLIAGLCVLGATLLAGCGGDGGGEGAMAVAEPRPGPPSATEPQRPEGPATLALDPPAGAHPLVWVRTGARVTVRTEPDGGRVVERARRRTAFGSPSVFGVIRERDGWAGVTTAALPNNQLGWIELDPENVKGGWTRASVEVDLSERRAELHQARGSVHRFAVTVGAPGTDTPTGRFAVTDTFRRGDLNPAYGCCAVAISATQPQLPSGWLGGNRIAVHGTSGPLGVAASSGCVRAADASVSKLVSQMPLGAPVIIRA